MCIAIPMQVDRVEPGHACVAGRGERRRISTALVGQVTAGDWLLVFLDSARERIDAARAAEVNALLDQVQGALLGDSDPGFAADFDLPSRMEPAALAALTGQAP